MNQEANFMNQFQLNLQQQIREHRGWYIFQGILFVILGIFAFMLPGVTAVSFEILVGMLLLFGGIMALITCFKSEAPAWGYFSAILAILAGGIMLWKPLLGLFTLSILITFFLFLRGISDIVLAVQVRPMKSWGWLLLSGIISLMLAFIAWSGFPAAGVFILSIIIAVNLLLYGISLLALTWGVK